MTDVAAEQGAVNDAARRASGSSFYQAMRILPPAQRQAMFDIYSFCRAVDDIADDPGDRNPRRTQLQQWRRDIDALYEGKAPAHLRGLAQAVAEFALEREDFLAVIDGMEMDVESDIRAPDLAMLDLYCDRVASAVGRLSVKVFGLEAKAGRELAHHLGRALQLTNILRDLDEDAGLGRLYLPKELLTQAGINSTEPAEVLASPSLPKACKPLVERARAHYAEAEAIMRRNPRKLVKAPRIMGKVYGRLLDLLAERGFTAPRKEVRVSTPTKLVILLRYAFV